VVARRNHRGLPLRWGIAELIDDLSRTVTIRREFLFP